MIRRPPRSPLFPSPTLFRSLWLAAQAPPPVPAAVTVGRVTAVAWPPQADLAVALAEAADRSPPFPGVGALPDRPIRLDPKSTRLNSSHGYISYAVFCF